MILKTRKIPSDKWYLFHRPGSVCLTLDPSNLCSREFFNPWQVFSLLTSQEPFLCVLWRILNTCQQPNGISPYGSGNWMKSTSTTQVTKILTTCMTLQPKFPTHIMATVNMWVFTLTTPTMVTESMLLIDHALSLLRTWLKRRNC